jgi:DNA-binding response OmpR family regulator
MAGEKALSIQSKFLMVIPRSPPMAPDRPRILVIEDDLLIALMIEDMVREAGYRVSGVAHTIAVARHEIAKRNFDAVLFDLDIGRRSHPEIADFLLDTGVPFAFVTGYDYLVEPRHQTVPVLEKPFTPVQLRALLEKLVGSRSPTGEIPQTA